MSASYQFVDADRDTAGAEFIDSAEQGPVVWLQTTANGCYIPVARLAEFIEGLQNVAADKAAGATA